jgi:hypothetical protein
MKLNKIQKPLKIAIYILGSWIIIIGLLRTMLMVLYPDKASPIRSFIFYYALSIFEIILGLSMIFIAKKFPKLNS